MENLYSDLYIVKNRFFRNFDDCIHPISKTDSAKILLSDDSFCFDYLKNKRCADSAPFIIYISQAQEL